MFLLQTTWLKNVVRKEGVWLLNQAPTTNELNAFGDAFDGVLALYYELFSFMEDNELLDPFNEIGIAALHYIFIPLLNNKLDAWRHA